MLRLETHVITFGKANDFQAHKLFAFLVQRENVLDNGHQTPLQQQIREGDI